MSKYFTDKQLETMADNNIEYVAAIARVKRGMDPEEAVTKPSQPRNKYQELFEPYKEIAAENNVNYATWRKRVTHYDYTPKEAAETPLGQKRKPKRERDPYRELADDNNISQSTYSTRRNLGWSKEDAATIPTTPQNDRFKKYAECRRKAIEKGMPAANFVFNVCEKGLSFEEAIQ